MVKSKEAALKAQIASKDDQLSQQRGQLTQLADDAAQAKKALEEERREKQILIKMILPQKLSRRNGFIHDLMDIIEIPEFGKGQPVGLVKWAQDGDFCVGTKEEMMNKLKVLGGKYTLGFYSTKKPEQIPGGQWSGHMPLDVGLPFENGVRSSKSCSLWIHKSFEKEIVALKKMDYQNVKFIADVVTKPLSKKGKKDRPNQIFNLTLEKLRYIQPEKDAPDQKRKYDNNHLTPNQMKIIVNSDPATDVTQTLINSGMSPDRAKEVNTLKKYGYHFTESDEPSQKKQKFQEKNEVDISF